MDKRTFIFIGRSGCGKGTQAHLLETYFKERYPAENMFYLETGKRFRDFVRGKTYTEKLALDTYERNDRQPDFLAIHMWSHLFINEFTGNEHVLIDGTPRSLGEAQMLDTAMKFYGRNKPDIIFMNVSRGWSKERLLGRAREDDADDAIEKRLDWFDKDVAPAISYYKESSDYNFVDVNGEQSIREVHDDIMKQLFPDKQ